MRFVDEAAEIVWPAIQMTRSEKIGRIVAPAKLPGELRDRHQLDRRDAQLGKLGQLAAGRIPRARMRERPDVHLVERLPGNWKATPTSIAPGELVRIDDFRRAVWALGLK